MNGSFKRNDLMISGFIRCHITCSNFPVSIIQLINEWIGDIRISWSKQLNASAFEMNDLGNELTAKVSKRICICDYVIGKYDKSEKIKINFKLHSFDYVYIGFILHKENDYTTRCHHLGELNDEYAIRVSSYGGTISIYHSGSINSISSNPNIPKINKEDTITLEFYVNIQKCFMSVNCMRWKINLFESVSFPIVPAVSFQPGYGKISISNEMICNDQELDLVKCEYCNKLYHKDLVSIQEIPIFTDEDDTENEDETLDDNDSVRTWRVCQYCKEY
eukprot:24877_1